MFPGCLAVATGQLNRFKSPEPAYPHSHTAEQKVAAEWKAWKAKQPFTGDHSRLDSAPREQMARMSWYVSTAWTRPYPGDARILTPDEVPGAVIPGMDTDS